MAGDEEEAGANGLGWYVYGVTRAAESELVDLGVGLDGERPVQLITSGPLGAVVSLVVVDEFLAADGEPGSRDLERLVQRVRGHAAVEENVHRQGPVVPLKFGTMFRRREGVARMLDEHRAELLEDLQRFEGRDEWGIRIYVDWAELERSIRATDPVLRQLQEGIRAKPGGMAYLLRRRLEAEVASRLEASANRLADECYHRLAQRSQQTSPGASEPPEEGSSLRLMMKAAFLVPRTGRIAWLDEVETLAKESSALRCLPNGPWPPYSFVTLGHLEKESNHG